MSDRFPAEICITFPALGEHIDIVALTEKQGRRFKKALESGQFNVKMFIEEKREVR